MLFRAVVVGSHKEEEQQRARQEVASQRQKASYQRPVLWHFSGRSDPDASITGPFLLTAASQEQLVKEINTARHLLL